MTFADIGAAVDGGTHRNHEVVGDAIRNAATALSMVLIL
jgi:hypothetical protein